MKILFSDALLADGRTAFVTVSGTRIDSVSEVRPEGAFDRVIDCRRKLLLPGLYNVHTHAAMQLFRGYGEDMPLDRWLKEKIWPAEDRLTEKAVKCASLFAIAEMLRGGIVSFSDMYFFSEQTAEAVLETGIKANISRSVVSFDPDEDPAEDSRFAEAKSLFERYHGAGDGRLTIDMCLHAEYTNTERMCRAMADWTRAHGARMQVHVSETEKEHSECVGRHGKTPMAFLRDAGVLDAPTCAAHCVWVTDDDMDIMREKGVTAVHNPTSNLKLGSGVMPLSKMASHGVNIALGTDSAASNNTLDIMKEMSLAAILHKGVEHDPVSHKAAEFLRMATENGALAQGRPDSGRIMAGCRADLMLLDLDTAGNIPMYDPVYTAVYSASSADCRLTMADGRILWENGEYTTLDWEKLKHEMRETCENYF